MKVLEVGEGDELVAPTITFVATCERRRAQRAAAGEKGCGALIERHHPGELRTYLRRRISRNISGRPFFKSADVVVGEGVRFGRNVEFNCDRVRIGDGARIGDNVLVNAESFELGDYATIYSGCFFPGPGNLSIGHNFWLGGNSIIDSLGGTTIGNNVGIGAQSQLWTHMVYGDVLYGCRFHSSHPLEIGHDVWFVGHCLVSPIKAGNRSLAMLGALIVKDMAEDRSYAGAPAIDVTDRIGAQFTSRPIDDRVQMLERMLQRFSEKEGRDWRQIARIVTEWIPGDSDDPNITCFNVSDRTYTKHGSTFERRLIRYLLPDAKFTPHRDHALPLGGRLEGVAGR